MYQEYGVEYNDVDKEGNIIPFKKLEKKLLNKIMRENSLLLIKEIKKKIMKI